QFAGGSDPPEQPTPPSSLFAVDPPVGVRAGAGRRNDARTGDVRTGRLRRPGSVCSAVPGLMVGGAARAPGPERPRRRLAVDLASNQVKGAGAARDRLRREQRSLTPSTYEIRFFPDYIAYNCLPYSYPYSLAGDVFSVDVDEAL